MDVNLLRATVLLAMQDKKEIPECLLRDFLDSSYRVDLDDGKACEKRFLMFLETVKRNGSMGTAIETVRIHSGQLIRHAATYLNLNFAESEFCILENYVAVYQAGFAPTYDLYKDTGFLDWVCSVAEKLESYVGDAKVENHIIFYALYKINSELLRYAMKDLPNRRSDAYSVSRRMNAVQQWYDQIEFDGKDAR